MSRTDRTGPGRSRCRCREKERERWIPWCLPGTVPRGSGRCAQHTAQPTLGAVNCLAVQAVCRVCKHTRLSMHDPLWTRTRAAHLAAQRQVGALIRLGRQHRSWTLAHLGDRIGCSPATVSRRERRTRVIDLALLQRAALEVGMPRHVLVTSLAPPSAKATAATKVTGDHPDRRAEREQRGTVLKAMDQSPRSPTKPPCQPGPSHRSRMRSSLRSVPEQSPLRRWGSRGVTAGRGRGGGQVPASAVRSRRPVQRCSWG